MLVYFKEVVLRFKRKQLELKGIYFGVLDNLEGSEPMDHMINDNNC